jgi:hypothetical protein
MKALIYIEITETIDYFYEKEVLVHVKNKYPDIVTFDLDNHSDALMVDYAIELLEKSDKSIIIVESKNNFSSSKILLLSEKILKHQDKCLLILNGENKNLNKIFSQIKNNFLKNLSLEEEIKAIEKYL